MRLTRRRIILLAVLAALCGLAAYALHLTPEQRLFRDCCSTLAQALNRDGATSFQTTLEVEQAEGLPKELAHTKIELTLQGPEHLRLRTKVAKEPIEIGRNGQQLWVVEPERNFALLGAKEIPRFASNPASVEATKLGPLFDRKPWWFLKVLPYLTEVERKAGRSIDHETHPVVEVRPRAFVRALAKLPPISATVTLRAADSAPTSVEFTDGRNLHAAVSLHETKIGAPRPPAEWELHASNGTPVERVALSHLTRFLESAYPLLSGLGPAAPKAAELAKATDFRAEEKSEPPAAQKTGDTEAPAATPVVLATHGAGRLESRDGHRVLFLRGTPEEMGEQHGALVGPQVRDVVSRVLYGVGVGSSFQKGEWFFGKIEGCVARLQPFIDARHLREMDALAKAAGCDREEIRLANFFPELFHCSGFALMGSATQGGRIFHGRILDYMKGIGLEQNAIVIVSQPETGHAWVNLGYAGFIGSVTAMNDAGISIGEMGGRGEGNWDGKPMAQLVREVMEKAGTLEEALDLMRQAPRTCEYYYVIADGKSHTAAGVKATPQTFEVVRPGESHPQLDTPVTDCVLLSAGDRYRELTRRVQAGFGHFEPKSARELMTRPVCMNSNIQSVLFAPDTLDFWVANAETGKPASHTPYARYNLNELLGKTPPASNLAQTK